METLPTTTAADPSPTPGWGPVARTVFRFACVYVLLYSWSAAYNALTTVASLVYYKVSPPDPAAPAPLPKVFEYARYPVQWFEEGVGWFTPRACRALLNLEVQPPERFTGSGDGQMQYARCFAFLVVAVSVGLLWTLASELWMRLRTGRRPNYDRLHAAFRLVVRAHLGSILIGYGLAKVWCSQYPPVSDFQLETKYGDSSLMGLLWRFMQSSQPYTTAAGVIEMVAGLPLLFRRTTLLGALAGGGVMFHVFLLNMCYDVPVKLMSGHMVLLASALVAPDWRRLLSFFVLARPAGPPTMPALFAGWKWGHRTGLVLRTVMSLAYVALSTDMSYKQAKETGILSTPKPFVGRWVGVEFERDGEKVPFPEQPDNPPLTQFTPTKWAGEAGVPAVIRVSVQPRFQTAAFVFVDLTVVSCQFRLEADETELVLTTPQRPEPLGRLRMSFPDPDRMVLEGPFGQQRVKMTLRRISDGKKEYLLKTTGFRWVQEMPFNR